MTAEFVDTLVRELEANLEDSRSKDCQVIGQAVYVILKELLDEELEKSIVTKRLGDLEFDSMGYLELRVGLQNQLNLGLEDYFSTGIANKKIVDLSTDLYLRKYHT